MAPNRWGLRLECCCSSFVPHIIAIDVKIMTLEDRVNWLVNFHLGIILFVQRLN